MTKEVRLSASRIKCANECSWRYYCKYVLKIPDTSNDGARRGSVTHAVLECLLRVNKKRRKEYAEAILAANDPRAVPVIKRMIEIQSVFYELNLDEENWELISKFILVGLKFDFYLDEFDLQDPELAFNLTEMDEDGRKYSMIGFIDKFAIKDDYARIVDYKTSKQKFSEKELSFSIQALMYMLALKKLYPNLTKIDCDFLFLKFVQKPLQRITYEGQELEDTLKGVEEYLFYVADQLKDYDLKKAGSKFAADDWDTKWLCGRNPKKWKCPYRNKVRYYAVVDDKTGETISSNRDKSKLKVKDGQTIKTFDYGGCPKFAFENY